MGLQEDIFATKYKNDEKMQLMGPTVKNMGT